MNNKYTSGLEFQDGLMASPKKDLLRIKMVQYESSNNQIHSVSYDLYQPYTDNNDFSNETIDLSKVINRTTVSHKSTDYETYDVSGYIENIYDISSNKINKKLKYRFHEPSMNGLPDSSFSNVNRLKPTDASGNFTLSLIPSNINMLSSDVSNSNVSIDISTNAKQIKWYYHIKTDKTTQPHLRYIHFQIHNIPY